MGSEPSPLRGRRLQPALGILGAAGLAGSLALVVLGVRPFATHAYELCWWSLIAALDGLVWWRTGRSPIGRAPFRFLLLCLWSVALWFFFELVNLRLRNWHYIYVGEGTAERWTGSFLAFATVIPAISLCAEALRALGLFPGADGEDARSPRRLSPAVAVGLPLLGTAFLVLPLIWPRTLYPLVWGGLVLILDPLNRRRGARSLIGELEARRGGTILLYLAAGLVAGLFWEFLNAFARVKWIYTVPFFEEWKLFEMPLLGFLGFPPFALECWVFVQTLTVLDLAPSPGKPLSARRRAGLLALALAAAVILAGAALPAMDRITFASLYPVLDGRPELEEFRRAGIADVFELRRELERRGERRTPLGEWADLVLHAGIGVEAADALREEGVRSVGDLARADPARIQERLAARELRHRPTPAEVRYWVRRARKIPGDEARRDE